MRLFSALLNLLLPIECLGCGTEGTWLCSACQQQLKFSDQDQTVNLNTPDLNQIFIAGDYNDPLLAKLIQKYKYNFITTLGRELSKFLNTYWENFVIKPTAPITISSENLLSFDYLLNNKPENNSVGIPNNKLVDRENFLVVPIPLFKKRLRWRGFNQAEILARSLSNQFLYSLSLDLVRLRAGQAQAGLSETERATNIQGAFTWQGINLNNKNILLVDDVITSGATLNAAAAVLKRAGASTVYALVLAKG